MDRDEAIQKVARIFQRYYDINWDNAKEPFVGEAEFHAHDERYFISKSAKLFESDSREYVFFASEVELSVERLEELDRVAWEEGLSRVNLEENHKSTDVALIILADQIDEAAAAKIRKIHHYKSYAFTLKGWSNYRLIALEVSTGKIFHNRQGETLKKPLANIAASMVQA